MKMKQIVIAMALAGTAPLAAAEETPKEERRGAFGGMVVGAAVGGPLGAGVGAIVGGALIGKTVATYRQNEALNIDVAKLRADLHSQSAEKAEYESLIADLNSDLDRLIALQSDSWRQQQLPIQFRTASSHIESHYEAELDKIARVLTRNKDASVTLSGFADRRGESEFNQQLSEQRVTRVKHYLLARGVQPHQMIIMAFGESRPLDRDESLETNFFDRRVVLELSLDVDAELATR